MSADECRYYYYDKGYCCAVKREKSDGADSSVDSDHVKKYCWNYGCEDCNIYKNRDSSSGWCFLTTACAETLGRPDNCYELTTLREFRDGYMKSLPNGPEEIQKYYRIAPTIVRIIKEKDNSREIFTKIYHDLVQPCVKLIEEGHLHQAYERYRDYTLQLEVRYLS